MFLPGLLNYYTLSLLFGGVIAILSGLAPYLNNSNDPANRAWFFLNISAAVWSFGYLAMITSSQKEVAASANSVLHAAAILIPLFYFRFSATITQNFEKYRHVFYGFAAAAVLFLILNPTTLFVRDVMPKLVFNYAPDAGPLYIYFAIYFFSAVIYGFKIIYSKSLVSPENTALQLKYLLFVSAAGFIGGGSVFFLTFNINFSPYPLILFALYPAVISYAMLKHRFLDVKIIATELLTFALWVFLLARVFVSETVQGLLADIILLAATSVLGVFLIKSVLKEVEQRERLAVVAKELTSANKELKKLDQLKSDFLSFVSHQLREPLTVIKGYISMMQEGTFGKIPDRMGEVLDKVYVSNEKLIRLVNDFLNLSRIEQGRVQFEFEKANVADLAGEAVEMLKQNADKKKIELSWQRPEEKIPDITIDKSKIYEVVYNLIDNAIKYTPKGRVEVKVSKKPKSVLVSVADTGIGMDAEDKKKLFQRFSRADSGKKTNIGGSGIGLYVAKYMIEAHKGKIWAQSAGKDKGSTFTVELPINRAIKN